MKKKNPSSAVLAALFLSSPAAWAGLIENTSGEPVEIALFDGETVTIDPQTATFVPEEALWSPDVRQLMREGTLRVFRGGESKVKLTEAYCLSDEYPDDVSYCYLDLAEQDAAPYYCAMLETWSASRECLYYVDRKRKLTVNDCYVFDPGSTEREQCVEYVESGIPSKPGLSYEASLKLE